MKPILSISAMLFLVPNAVLADSHGCAVNMSVRFVEGTPVDRFVITNESKVAIAQAEVLFDLRPWVGKLIFDTQSNWSGVEVFNPFKVKLPL